MGPDPGVGHILEELGARGRIIVKRGDDGGDLGDLVGGADRLQLPAPVDQEVPLRVARRAAQEDWHGLAVRLDGALEVCDIVGVEPLLRAQIVDGVGIEIPDVMTVDRVTR